ncbi:hypothetical protein HYH03_014785 [Edaphochlamys debaryana]|uniref:Protein kinase domain-containing protein n=1 Tax=Edaphochlamys debaryana TaxID=47281 RepID=A0A835XMA9_9CHLO|nr:hypothetical protein HYH03_014785 [Edaphochlamys debaryana]|eukprot:KAG2486481.1 hypothetical protein HYH03_014785 [Edaphochlamys debaryana]
MFLDGPDKLGSMLGASASPFQPSASMPFSMADALSVQHQLPPMPFPGRRHGCLTTSDPASDAQCASCTTCHSSATFALSPDESPAVGFSPPSMFGSLMTRPNSSFFAKAASRVASIHNSYASNAAPQSQDRSCPLSQVCPSQGRVLGGHHHHYPLPEMASFGRLPDADRLTTSECCGHSTGRPASVALVAHAPDASAHASAASAGGAGLVCSSVNALMEGDSCTSCGMLSAHDPQAHRQCSAVTESATGRPPSSAFAAMSMRLSMPSISPSQVLAGLVATNSRNRLAGGNANAQCSIHSNSSYNPRTGSGGTSPGMAAPLSAVAAGPFAAFAANWPASSASEVIPALPAHLAGPGSPPLGAQLRPGSNQSGLRSVHSSSSGGGGGSCLNLYGNDSNESVPPAMIEAILAAAEALPNTCSACRAPPRPSGGLLPLPPMGPSAASALSPSASASASMSPAPSASPAGTMPRMCSNASAAAEAAASMSLAGEPHPADNLLRITDLETCATELRDLSFIGSGSSGNVYSGTWCGMPVAVKFMLSGDVDQLLRQQREAALCRLASHPHMVQTYAVAAAQLTPAHFQSDTGSRPTCLTNTDLLGTCMAGGGTAADLYGTTNLSRSVSVDIGHLRPTTSVGSSAPAGAAAHTSDQDFSIGFVSGANALLVAAAAASNVQLQPPLLQPTFSGNGLISASAHSATPKRASRDLSQQQQLRNRLAGLGLHTAGSASVVSAAAGVPGPAASASCGGNGGAPAQLSPRVKAAFSCTNLGARQQQQQQQQQGGGSAAPNRMAAVAAERLGAGNPSPKGEHRPFRLDRRSRAALAVPPPPALPQLTVPASALASAISTVDIQSPMFQVEGKQDSFDMATASGCHAGLLPLQMADVLAHISARPGQWLTVIVMEEMDRGSLHRSIHHGLFHPTASRLSKRHRIRGIVRTLTEVAQGMAHLHSSGLVHGDLKPANVLLKANSRDLRGFIAKVSDFGVTRAVAEGTNQATVSTSDWGTVIYTAPEVFNGKSGPASDVFSFGVLTWHLLTGQLPHEDLNPFAVMLAVSKGELGLDWPASVPKPLRKLGRLCTQHNPDERPTFAEIARALLKLEARMRQHSTGTATSGPSTPTGSNTGRIRGAANTSTGGRRAS